MLLTFPFMHSKSKETEVVKQLGSCNQLGHKHIPDVRFHIWVVNYHIKMVNHASAGW